MRIALQNLPELADLLAEVSDPRIGELAALAAPMDEVCQLLEHAIIENPPVIIRDGGVLAPGYNAELDEWRDLADGATKYLEELEASERERHDIDSLKVGFNQVHGFYIQVSRGQSHLVPSHYIRRQTLKMLNAILSQSLKSTKIKCLTPNQKR